MKARRLPVRIVVPLIVLPVVIAVGMKAQPTAATGRQSVDARMIYLRDCAVCHGADGHGTDDGPTLQGWGRAGVDYALTTGRMPLPSPTAKTKGRPPHYDAPTIAALEDYIAALVPGGPDIPRVDVAAGSVSNGGEIYRAQCAACHEWAGDGGALLEREAPPLGM